MEFAVTTGRFRTFATGALATAAMMTVARAAQSRVMADLQDLTATLTAPSGSTAGERFGYLAQLVNGGLFAQLYDWTFETCSIRPAAFLRHRGPAAAAMLVTLHGLFGSIVGSSIAASAKRQTGGIL